MAAWFGRGLSILLSLLLMPALFGHLSKQELGVWLLLGQSYAVLGIFDLGFGIVLTRRIAFAVGKRPKGPTGELPESSVSEISDLVGTGKRVYRWLAFSSLIFSFGLGSAYLGSLELHGVSTNAALCAWGALCLSQAVGIWAAVWTCLLQGMGYVGWDGIIGSLLNCVTLLVQIALLFLGGGLVGLAVVAAMGALAQRWLLVAFIRKRCPQVLRKPGTFRSAVFRSLLRPAFRAWFTAAGYLLVSNTDPFFIASQQGAGAIPAYRAAFLLVINLHLLAGVFSASSPVFVSQLWEAGRLPEIRTILRRNAQIGLLAMAGGAAAILALGPTLFEVWLGKGNFVGYPVLVVFLATFFLEHHANVFSTCGRATNDEAYAGWSVAAGLLKVAFAILLTRRLGLTGLALSTLLGQGLTNDWFMVYRSAQRLGVDFLSHAREVLAPVGLMFVATLGLCVFVNQLLAQHAPVVRVGMVSAAAGATLALAIWRLVLDRQQRSGLLRWAISSL